MKSVYYAVRTGSKLTSLRFVFEGLNSIIPEMPWANIIQII